MSEKMTKEKYVEILKAAAAQRLGQERAHFLDPAIQDIAQSLAALAGQEIALEEEPAFFQ